VTFTTVAGASSYWLRFPENVDTRALAREAASLGVLIEPGDVFFDANATEPVPFNYARLGFASIDASRIDAGLAALALACSNERRVTNATSSPHPALPQQD